MLYRMLGLAVLVSGISLLSSPAEAAETVGDGQAGFYLNLPSPPDLHPYLYVDETYVSVDSVELEVAGFLKVDTNQRVFELAVLKLTGDGSPVTGAGQTDLRGTVVLQEAADITIQNTSLLNKNSVLEVNWASADLGAVVNGGSVLVNAAALSTSFVNQNSLTLRSGSTLMTAGFTTASVHTEDPETSTPFSLSGNGTLHAGSVSLDTMADFGNGPVPLGTVLAPDAGVDAATLSIDLPAAGELSLVNSLLMIDVLQDESNITNDKLVVDGSVDVGGKLSAVFLDNFTDADLIANGPLVVLEADQITGTMSKDEPFFFDVYVGLELIGSMEIVQTATTVSLVYVAVPEPSVLVLSLLPLSLLFRRRA